MNIHEYQAKSLLKEFGVAVPRGGVAFSAKEADAVAKDLGGPVWVVKSQIHAGGRGAGRFFLAQHPVDRGARVEFGRVIDRQDIGARIHRQHKLRAGQHHRVGLAALKLGQQRLERALAVAADDALGQFVKDDPVDGRDPVGRDREDVEPGIFIGGATEFFGHHEPRAEQGDRLAAVGNDLLDGRRRNPNERQAGRVLDRRTVAVGGVRRDQDRLRTGSLQALARGDDDFFGCLEIAGVLERGIGREVEVLEG